MTPPSLCFLSRRAGSPPPDAAIRDPLGPRRSSAAFRPPKPSPAQPAPGPARAAGALPHFPPLTLREQEAGAGLARDAGAVGPGRSLRDGLAGRPGAAAAGRERVGAAGGGGAAATGSFFCSCSSTERGRDTPELGKWEEGRGGEQRGRRREDRRLRRLTLLAALARRLLTPPPAAGRADSEGEPGGRREDRAPRGPSDGALRRLCRCRRGRGSRERASEPDYMH